MSNEEAKRERSGDDAEPAAEEQPSKKAAKSASTVGDADPAVLEKVMVAIRRLKSHTGSSLKAIQKTIGDDVPVEEIKVRLRPEHERFMGAWCLRRSSPARPCRKPSSMALRNAR